MLRFVYGFQCTRMSGDAEQIAVCADTSDALAKLVGVVRDVGRWETYPVQWPGDAEALRDLTATAVALLFHSGGKRPPEELCTRLGQRS